MKLCKETQLTSLKSAFLSTLLGNEAQIRNRLSTRRLKTGDSSTSVQHSGIRPYKTATKGTMGKGSRS